ncbi:MAG: hypothetical protein DRR19_32100, partial [Candidatus Parabeggiatoa sp. nov. 1]
MTVSGRWPEILRESQLLMSEAFADGTWVNLRTQWKKFDAFCEYFDLVVIMPVTTEVIVAYIT